MKSWQRKWDQDIFGFYTRWLIPKVGTKVLFPDNCNIGISYCHLLLHDTMLREDSHRTGTADSPVCECGLDTESAEHFCYTALDFKKQEIQDTLDGISDSTARKGGYSCQRHLTVIWLPGSRIIG